MDTQLVVLGGGPGGYAAAFLAADLGMQVTLVDLRTAAGRRLPAARLHPLQGPAARGQGHGRGRTPRRLGRRLSAAGRRPRRHAGAEGKGHRHAHRRAETNQPANARCGWSAPGPRSQTRKRSAWRPSTASRWPTIASASSIASWPAAPGPTRIPAFDLPTPRVMDSTGALELPDVPESLLVVGGGYIGLEMGTVYAALGSRVSVVEMTDGLLPGADRDLVRPLQKRLEQQFAAIYLNTKVVGLADKKDAIEVDLRGRRQDRGPAVQPRAGVGGPPAQQRRPGPGEHQGGSRPAGASSSSTASGGRPIRTSWPSATWPASRCWPTRPPTRARWPSRCWPASRPPSQPRAIPAVVFTDPEIAWAGLTETEAKQAGPPRRGGPVPLGRQRPGPVDRPHRRADQVAHRSRERPAARLRHRRRRAPAT